MRAGVLGGAAKLLIGSEEIVTPCDVRGREWTRMGAVDPSENLITMRLAAAAYVMVLRLYDHFGQHVWLQLILVPVWGHGVPLVWILVGKPDEDTV